MLGVTVLVAKRTRLHRDCSNNWYLNLEIPLDLCPEISSSALIVGVRVGMKVR